MAITAAQKAQIVTDYQRAKSDTGSPEVQVALEYLVGAGLLVGGVWLHRKNYGVVGQTLCATAIVALYAVTFAAPEAAWKKTARAGSASNDLLMYTTLASES